MIKEDQEIFLDSGADASIADIIFIAQKEFPDVPLNRLKIGNQVDLIIAVEKEEN